MTRPHLTLSLSLDSSFTRKVAKHSLSLFSPLYNTIKWFVLSCDGVPLREFVLCVAFSPLETASRTVNFPSEFCTQSIILLKKSISCLLCCYSQGKKYLVQREKKVVNFMNFHWLHERFEGKTVNQLILWNWKSFTTRSLW